MGSLERIFAQHPFSAGMDPEHLKLLAACGAEMTYRPGELLFREGSEAGAFYLLLHGKVALEMFAAERGVLTVRTLVEGEVIGWLWLIRPYHWTYDARAVELTRAVALDGARLIELCESNHDLGYELLKRFALVMAHTSSATSLQLMDVYATKG